MLLSKNPNDAKVRELCKKSKHNAVKWLKDVDTGDTYYWPAEECNHSDVANMLSISGYRKGIAVPG